MFEKRCSPFSWLGPARYTEPPCYIDDIPFIDVVVISHNHYDHLSLPTINKIRAKHPNVHFFAPLGNKKWFTDCDIHNMTELDWWETRDVKLSPVEKKPQVDENPFSNASEADITSTFGCLPCQHMTARTPFDRMETLWASWSVESGGKKIWFGGYVRIFSKTRFIC